MASFYHVFIAVMGMTGSGKSTLIKTLTGKDVIVGHSLHACTEKVEDYYFQLDQYIVHLVDTPGFDDTNKSDTETLQEVAIWLANTYRSQIRLTGILYLQRITDNRLGGCAMLNLKMFKKMCGPTCLPNVILLTTMWGGSPEQIALQNAREQELKTSNEFWGGLLRLGALAKRYDGTAECGMAFIKDMLARPQIVLDIQRQIVDEGKNLNETAAGQQLREEMAKLEEIYKQQMRDMQEEMDDALRKKDQKSVEELRKCTAQVEEKLRQMDGDKERLDANLQATLQQHQMIIQEMASRQRTTWAIIGGIAIGALTGGLGMLAGMAIAGGTAAGLTGTAAIASLSALPAAQMAGELGRRAIMGATQGVLQLGAAALLEGGPRHAAQAISSRIQEL